MISADFDLNLSGFFDSLKTASAAASNLKIAAPSLGISGLGDSANAISSMQTAFAAAASAATPLAAALSRIEGTLHGAAGVARITSAAMALLPQVFDRIHPAVTRTLSAVSLASRGFDVMRGRMGPIGAVTAFLEARNLGLNRSYAALISTVGLATSTVVASSRAVVASAHRISAAAAMLGRGVAAGLGVASTAAVGLSAAFAPLAALAGTAALIAAPFVLIGKSVSAAAEFEGYQTGFVTLLGSVDAAFKRMQKLAHFADATPYELPGTAKASLVLETLTRGALSTGAGLTLVGDVAAAAGEPIEELAMHIGRLYDGLQSGRQVGVSLMRLQELGLVSGDTRTKIEDLQKSGKKGAEVWDVAAAALGRFSGNMDRMSRTWTGLTSTLADNIGALFRNFGIPVMGAFKPMLLDLVRYTESLGSAAAQAGEVFAAGIRAMHGAILSGRIGELLGGVLEVGMLTALENFRGAWMTILSSVWGGLKSVPAALFEGLKGIIDPAFWGGLRLIFNSIATSFAAALAGAIAPVVDGLLNVLRHLGVNVSFEAGKMADSIARLAESQLQTGQGMMTSTLMGGVSNGIGQILRGMLGEGAKFLQPGQLADAQGRLTKLMADLGKLAPRFAPEKPVAGAVADPNATSESATKFIASSLAAVGLGGYTASSAVRPELNESRKQTALLEAIRASIQEQGRNSRRPERYTLRFA